MNEGNTGAFIDSEATQAQWDIFSWAMMRGRLKEYEQWTPNSNESGLSDEAKKKAYIVSIAGTLNFLGLHNLDEPESLLIEPAHCFDPQEIAKILASLPGGLDSKLLGSLKLDLLDPYLVRQYMPVQSVEIGAGGSATMAAQNECSDAIPAVLFDPLYGMAIIPKEGRWRQICFADTIWRNRIIGMSPNLISQHLARTLDSLSEGVLIAKQFLSSALPEEAKEHFENLSIPELVLHSPDDLSVAIRDLHNALAKSGVDLKLWFRGQPTDYLVPDRTILVQNGMAKYCSVRDSSLIPSLYRNIDFHNAQPSRFMRLVRHLGDWAVTAKSLLPPAVTILDSEGRIPYRPKPVALTAQSRVTMFMAGRPHLDIPSLQDLGPYSLFEVLDKDGNVIDSYMKLHHPSLQGFRTMLLLQHYGCPTPWVDITHDCGIALWFALHRLDRLDEGTFKAERVGAVGNNPEEWPTIYVFALNPKLHPVIDTTSILAGSRFVRPQVQQCGLLGGAGNLARNYAARFIALKLRLGPGFSSVVLPRVEEIFPPKSDDSGLRDLLEAETHPKNDRLFRVYDVSAGTE